VAKKKETPAEKKHRLLMQFGIFLFMLGVVGVVLVKVLQSDIRHKVASGEVAEERYGDPGPMTKTVIRAGDYQLLDTGEYISYAVGAIGALITIVTSLQKRAGNGN
jgi:hypothetical protein